MECLDEETVVALLEGQLGDQRLGDVDRHIDGCATCRRLVSSLAEPAPGVSLAPTDPLGPGVGAVLGGRFELQAVAGTGGMARIYRARDLASGVTVAVKRVDVDEARFAKEVRLLAELSHPSIVRYVDDGTCDDGTRYMAMEWLEGEDLAQRLSRGRLSIDEARRLGIRVAEALAYAHANGVVHRDIKPSNLFLVGGDVDRVMVVDFGVARATSSLATRTRTGALLGTPGFMAPEQARGEVSVGPRADVFSLGCVLYECVTGARAFPGANIIAVLSNLLTAKAPHAKDRVPSVPRELDALIARMLARDPLKRPPDCDAVARELAHLERASSARRRRRAILLAIAAILSGVLLGALVLHGRAPKVPGAEAAARKDYVARPITDFSAPPSAVPEAAQAYAGGLRALRAAKLVEAKDYFTRALELDPSLTQAHLRLAVWTDATIGAEESRRHFQLARTHQATLSERDRAFLDAVEPAVVREPPDDAEAKRRMRALADAYPGDAELMLLAVGVGSSRGAVADYDRVLSLDPAFAQAWAERARAQMPTDLPGALASIDRCLAVSPGSTMCLLVRTRIDAQAGDCAAMEKDARAVIAAENGSEFGYSRLANALYSTGKDRAAVAETLRMRMPLVPAATRDRVRALAEAQLAAGYGDFAGAEASARELARLVEGADFEQAHVPLATFLVDLLEERGDTAGAGAVADAFLRRRSGWRTLATRPPDDPRPYLFAAAARAGLRPKSDVAAARDAWATEWRSRLGDGAAGEIWLEGWARPSRDPESARGAVAAVPAGVSPDRITVVPGWVTLLGFSLAGAGRAQLLAGDPAGAAKTLRVVTQTCSALGDTIGHTRAHLLLGNALAASGDQPGACVAYRVVLGRWGAAKPRSVSADDARARARALGCAP